MKEFQCGTLVPGCDWHTRAEEEAEVMRRAVEHMRETHGGYPLPHPEGPRRGLRHQPSTNREFRAII